MLVVFGRGALRVQPPAGMVAYDARAHRLLGGEPRTFTQEHSPAVVVLAPQQVAKTALTAPRPCSEGRPRL